MGRELYELNPGTRWLGQRLDVHAVVDSTNLVAEKLARAGAPDGTVVIADRQTAGRGRLGRSFFSPGGRSLYLSVILREPVALPRLPEHVFAAAVAVAELTAGRVSSGSALEIKWPNDVMLGGRKLSGINLPAHLEAGALVHAVLGIGVNVNTRAEEFPEELRALATSLRIETGREHDRVALAEELLERLEALLLELRAGSFGPVLERWRRFFKMAGREVHVGGPGLGREAAVEGRVEGVDPSGALLLRTERGRERVLAGDVTLRE